MLYQNTELLYKYINFVFETCEENSRTFFSWRVVGGGVGGGGVSIMDVHCLIQLYVIISDQGPFIYGFHIERGIRSHKILINFVDNYG